MTSHSFFFGSIPFSQLHKLLFPEFQFFLEYTAPSTKISCLISLDLFVDNHSSHIKGHFLLGSQRWCTDRLVCHEVKEWIKRLFFVGNMSNLVLNQIKGK